jgi:hypothetical protein
MVNRQYKSIAKSKHCTLFTRPQGLRSLQLVIDRDERMDLVSMQFYLQINYDLKH